MAEVASRELRNNTRGLLDRVAAGERLTITVQGRPVADLMPVSEGSHWFRREDFVRSVLTNQADPGLADELAALADETTDDLPWH